MAIPKVVMGYTETPIKRSIQLINVESLGLPRDIIDCMELGRCQERTLGFLVDCATWRLRRQALGTVLGDIGEGETWGCWQ
jgi:hypothetical protein